MDEVQPEFIHMSDFSSRLREERKRLGMSQEQLAESGGVKLNAQSNYENGHRSPDAAYLERLVAVGVDAAYLVTGARTSGPGLGKAEDWRLLPNPTTAQSVLDRLAEMAESRALEVADWQLIDQLISRLSRG